jgi:hypothetical protein
VLFVALSCIQDGNDFSSIKDCAANPLAGNVPSSVFCPGREEERIAECGLAATLSPVPVRSVRIQLGNVPSSTRSAVEKFAGFFAGGTARSPARNVSSHAGSSACP